MESKWGSHANLQTHAMLFVQALVVHTNKNNKTSSNLSWKSWDKNAFAKHCCHYSEGKIRGREITFQMKQILWNLQYLVFLKNTLPGTLVNQCPCVFIRCINTIVQIAKPYDLIIQLIINCGPKNYKIPSAKAHLVSCTS